MNQENEKMRLRRMIDELSFVMDDTRLFLDTHPNNQEALIHFDKTMHLRNRALMEYTNKYGPIYSYDVNVNYGWNWNDCPLPWNGGI